MGGGGRRSLKNMPSSGLSIYQSIRPVKPAEKEKRHQSITKQADGASCCAIFGISWQRAFSATTGLTPTEDKQKPKDGSSETGKDTND